jgi:hypothetical protein
MEGGRGVNFSLEQYEAFPPLKFPLQLRSGFLVQEVQSHCPKCGSVLISLRGEVTEQGVCSEVRFAGLCHPCFMLVTCRFRHYHDGRIIQEGPDGWENLTATIQKSLRVRIFLVRMWTRIRCFFGCDCGRHGGHHE